MVVLTLLLLVFFIFSRLFLGSFRRPGPASAVRTVLLLRYLRCKISFKRNLAWLCIGGFNTFFVGIFFSLSRAFVSAKFKGWEIAFWSEWEDGICSNEGMNDLKCWWLGGFWDGVLRWGRLPPLWTSTKISISAGDFNFQQMTCKH